MKTFYSLIAVSVGLVCLAATPPPKQPKPTGTETITATARRQPEYPPPITVPCVRVIDGDTIKIPYKGRIMSLRLIGIDAPEYGEDGFDEARQFVVEHCLEKDVRIEFDQVLLDRYGRLLGYVFVPPDQIDQAQPVSRGDSGGTAGRKESTDDLFLNAELLQEGLAVYVGHYETKRFDQILWKSFQERTNL